MQMLLLLLIASGGAPCAAGVPGEGRAFAIRTSALRRPALAYVAGRLALLSQRTWVLECGGQVYALQTVLMACPNQASNLQGALSVSRDILAADDLGTGSGWQQSKQN